MPDSRETMKQMSRKRKALMREGQACFTHEEITFFSGMPVDFWQGMVGRIFETKVDKERVTVALIDQAGETRELGRKIFDDLIAGYSSGRKESAVWRRTYKQLGLVVQSAYQQRDLTSLLGRINLDDFQIDSLRPIFNQLQEGKSLEECGLAVEDLHQMMAIIWHNFFSEGTRFDIGLPPETIGSAATR